jgi:hypothetical protein
MAENSSNREEVRRTLSQYASENVNICCCKKRTVNLRHQTMLSPNSYVVLREFCVAKMNVTRVAEASILQTEGSQES